MTALCVRGLAAARALHWLAAALVLAAVAAPARAEESIVVQLDQARVMKLPERAATLVIGDPLIADVSIQPGGLAVVTGKGYGATNFIAMDRSGEVLVDRVIEVAGPTDQLVTIYRGVERETYSCMPVCQRRVTLGDGSTFFKSAIEQAGSLSAQAASSAAASGK